MGVALCCAIEDDRDSIKHILLHSLGTLYINRIMCPQRYKLTQEVSFSFTVDIYQTPRISSPCD